MIDIESKIFTLVYNTVQQYDNSIYVTSEYSVSPPSFPAVSVIETENNSPERFRTSSRQEIYAEIRTQITIYSNEPSGPKARLKSIHTVIDNALRTAGLRLTGAHYSYLPQENSFNRAVAMLTANYECIADEGGNIYATR